MNSFRQGRGGSARSASAVPSKGFTLIELMLVLMVIALAGLVVYPDLRPLLDGTRVKAAVKKTAAFLDDIRTESVLTNETLVVGMTETGNGIVARRENDQEGVVDELSLEGILTGPVEEVIFDPPEIRYDPQGSSSGGEVLFRSDGAAIGVVQVGSFTGLSRIVDGSSR